MHSHNERHLRAGFLFASVSCEIGAIMMDPYSWIGFDSLRSAVLKVLSTVNLHEMNGKSCQGCCDSVEFW